MKKLLILSFGLAASAAWAQDDKKERLIDAHVLGQTLLKGETGLQKTAVKPIGVFTLSSPIDLEDLSLAFKKDIDSAFCNRKTTREAIYMDNKMRKEIGTPSTNYENYVKYSPYLIISWILCQISIIAGSRNR